MSALGFFFFIVFVTSWFLHLPTRYPMLGMVRFDVIVVAITVLATMAGGLAPTRTAAEKRVRWWLLVLVAYVFVSLPLVEWPGSVLNRGLEAFIKAAVFYFFTTHLVTTNRRLAVLLTVFIACQTFRVLEPLYLHQTQGYWGSKASMANWEFMNRLAGAPSDIVNPNGLAYVILTALSFSHFLMAGPILRTAYVGLLPLHLYTLVLTGSRSGFLGLVAVYGVIWWRSPRKLLLTAIAGAVVLFALPRLDAVSLDRYASIFTSDARNASTADGRLAGVIKNFETAMRRPLFGHGLGTSAEANANFGGRAQPAHNLYAETAQELGFIGLGILVGLIVAMWRNTAETLKMLKQTQAAPFVLRVANSLQLFLAMNLLFSLASYGLTSYEWYFMAGLSEVLARLSLPAPVVERVMPVPGGYTAPVSHVPAHVEAWQ